MMRTVEELAEIAVLDFTSPGDYVDTATGRFRGAEFRKDHELTQSITRFLGSIEVWDCRIAAFEIDEAIILVRDEPQRLTIERWDV
jgi:hypothetical protein